MVVGEVEGLLLGLTDGRVDGDTEGLLLGDVDGLKLGDVEGLRLGEVEGLLLGAVDGDADGDAVMTWQVCPVELQSGTQTKPCTGNTVINWKTISFGAGIPRFVLKEFGWRAA